MSGSCPTWGLAAGDLWRKHPGVPQAAPSRAGGWEHHGEALGACVQLQACRAACRVLIRGCAIQVK